MRIGVDARALVPQRTGIGTYLAEILRHCPSDSPHHQFHLFAPRPIELPGELAVHQHIQPARWGLPWYLLKSHLLINPAGLDVFWGVQSLLPSGLEDRLPCVVTVQDCVHRLGVRYSPSALYNVLHRSLLSASLRRAQRIMVLSRFVADEIHRYYGVPLSRIELTPPGVSDAFHLSNIADEKTQRVLAIYRIPRPFILTVGTLEPRKNLKTLLRAFALLPAKVAQDYHLVLVGKTGWRASSLERDLRTHPLADRIIRTGYVPAEDLPSLYASADMYVFPSLYEGFGLPVLEAMAAGCPVVASNTSGLGEAVGSAGILVDPLGPVVEWSRAIERIARSSNLRNELREKGISRAGRYRWENCAKATIDLLWSVASR